MTRQHITDAPVACFATAVHRSDAAKQIDQVIFKRSTGQDITNPGAFGGASNETLSATNSFHQELSAWAAAHPTASLVDRNKAVADIGQRYVDAFTRLPGDAAMQKPGIYTPPAGSPSNAFSSAVQQKAQADQVAKQQQAQLDAAKPEMVEKAEKQRPGWWQRANAGTPWGMSGDELAAQNKAVDENVATIQAAKVAPVGQPLPPAPADVQPIDRQAYQGWMRGLGPAALARIDATAKQKAGQYGDPEAARQQIFRQLQARRAQSQSGQPGMPTVPNPAQPAAPATPGQALDKALQHPVAQGLLQKGAALLNPVSPAQAAETPRGAPILVAGSGQNLGSGQFGSINAAYTKSPDQPGEGFVLTPRQGFSYLKSLGATDKEALLLVGASANESSFNPNAIHDGGKGYGLFGHNAERLAAMRASAGGVDRPNWQQQYKFALGEARQLLGADRINGAQTPEDLADLEAHFERPRGYSAANPRGADNYNGRLNTIRHFASLAGGPDLGVADSGAKGGAPALPTFAQAGGGGALQMQPPSPSRDTNPVISTPASHLGDGLDEESGRVLDHVSEAHPEARFVVVPASNGQPAQVLPVDARGRVRQGGAEQEALASAVRASAKALGVRLNSTSGLKLFVERKPQSAKAGK